MSSEETYAVKRDDTGRWTATDGHLVGHGWNEVDAICDLLQKTREAKEKDEGTQG